MGMIHKAAAAMFAVALAGGAGAAVGTDGAPVFKKNLFGDRVAINIQRATRINDLAQDGANRTWFATQGAGAGAATIVGTALVDAGSPFPINTGDSGYLLSNDLSSVVFAAMGGQEHFFLGSATDPVGVRAGRLTVGVDFVGTPLFAATGAVNALATNGSGKVWVGTESGLRRVDLSGSVPGEEDPNPSVSGPIRRLADVSAAFGGTPAVAYVHSDTASDELRIHTGTVLVALPLFQDLSLTTERVEALFFQEAGAGGPALWAVEDDTNTSGQRWLVRYDNLGTTPVIGMAVPIDRPCFDDNNLQDRCNPTDLAINSVTGEFWLATAKGALFQVPDALGQLNPRVCGPGTDPFITSDDEFAPGDPCTTVASGWRPVPRRLGEPIAGSPEENYGAVLADPAGNVWLGSDFGLRSLIVRYLTLSGTRFIGLDKRAVVTLEDGEAEAILDLPDDPDDDPTLPDLPITVQVGATAVKFYVLPDVDGVYRLAFGFTSAADNDPVADPLHRFSVTPSVEGEDILVFYEFKDALGTLRKLEARATWAEIVPFEDDLWIGGPCFLDLLLPTRRGAAR